MSNQIQHKLFNYAEKPDPKVWSSIDNALNDQTSGASKKLFNFQQTPPANNWDNIVQKLDQKAAVIPFYKRYSIQVKRAGAVAAIALLILSIGLYINNKTASVDVAQQQTIPAIENTLPADEKANDLASLNSNTDIEAEKAEDTYFTKAHAYINAGLLKNKAQKLKTSAPKPHVEPSAIISTVRTEVVNDNLLDKYIVISAEDGNAVKLPKKIYDNLACTKDFIDYERACREALVSLQRKLASQVSTADFAGLIDMLQNLQENQ